MVSTSSFYSGFKEIVSHAYDSHSISTNVFLCIVCIQMQFYARVASYRSSDVILGYIVRVSEFVEDYNGGNEEWICAVGWSCCC